jgi:hypothetical protein
MQTTVWSWRVNRDYSGMHFDARSTATVQFTSSAEEDVELATSLAMRKEHPENESATTGYVIRLVHGVIEFARAIIFG